MTNAAVVVALVGLIVIITVHITVIARWSGRIDGYMVANDQRIATFMQATSQRFEVVEGEVKRLRDARHIQDGHIQRHEGMLRDLDRRQGYRRQEDQDESHER